MARETNHVKHAHSYLAKAIHHLENLMKKKDKAKAKVKDVKKSDGSKLSLAKKAKKKK
jgi:hypothetical protein